MNYSWTFQRKVRVGFSVVVALTAIISAVAFYALRVVVESKDRVISVNARNMIDAARLDAAAEAEAATTHGFLLTRERRFLDQRNTAQRDVDVCLAHLKANVPTEEGRRIVAKIEQAQQDLAARQLQMIETRTATGDMAPVLRQFAQTNSVLTHLTQLVDELVAREQRLLEQGAKEAGDRASQATTLVLGLAGAAVLFAILVAFLLTRTLSRQIGAVVQHVQSSAAELQTAAGQQATGAKETSTGMSEISTTIGELLASSRQIASGAQKVATIAQETAKAARSGDRTVHKTQDAIGGIRRQVDTIVTHMLDLGKKSQQIGGILDIINELAEQTNILAINASIEAAGAGEAGKRFGVVGDEIRKLSDRVGTAASDIRALIEEMRAAVNTTVMATEGGSKAVDAGLHDFGEMTSLFGQIGGLVDTTTEAAREIELSTKQQATAVEQVNLAVSSAAQATHQTEISTGQTQQTAARLATLSKDLSRIIQTQPSA